MVDSPGERTETATQSMAFNMQDFVLAGISDQRLLDEVQEGRSLHELLSELVALRKWKEDRLLEREEEHTRQQHMFDLLCERCDSAVRYLVYNEGNLANDLPIEILHAIFRFTLPPNALLDPTCRSFDHSWLQSMEQKTLLTQVCSRWRSAALPFLYEEVWLRYACQLHALQWTLSHNPEIAPLVKKLAVDIPTPPRARADFRTSVLIALATVLRECTDLKSLLFTDAFFVVEKLRPHVVEEVELLAFPAEIEEAIRERSGTLQYLEQWPQQSVNARYRFSLTTVMSCELLLSLTIDVDPAVGLEPVHLPLLEELDLSRHFAVWELPRLKRVVLPIATHRYSLFLRKHGKTITYLELRSHWIKQTPPTARIWGELASCPELRHLVLDDPRGLLTSSPSPLHPFEDQSLAHPSLKYIDFWTTLVALDLPAFHERRAKRAIASNVSWENVRLLDRSLNRLARLPTLFPPDQPSWELPSVHDVPGMSIVHAEWAVYRGDLPTVYLGDAYLEDPNDTAYVYCRTCKEGSDTGDSDDVDTEDEHGEHLESP
ncbi:hypothetical protein FKP32DRAFT_1669087 [Trametes sanguinea]|nr:hypothetical protein FKP32DRAFT_1669087 [Trametes sanguinea]